MIKHINTSEINELKSNLKEIIKVKKLLSKKSELEKFYEEEQPLNEAINIYRSILSCKYNLKEYDTTNDLMVSYLLKNKIIDVDHISIFEKYFHNSNVKDDYNYIDEMYKALEEITKVIEYICEKIGINYSKNQYSNLIVEDAADDEFKFIREGLLSDISNYSDIEENKSDEEDEVNYIDHIQEAFDEIFSDDSRVFCFKGYNLDIKIIEEINRWSKGEYQGFKTEVYLNNSNLYLDISICSIYYNIDIEFILLFICSLVKLRGK